MARFSLYAVAVASLGWSIFAYCRFAFWPGHGPLLVAVVIGLAVISCTFVANDVEALLGDGPRLGWEKWSIASFPQHAVRGRLILPALAIAMLLGSYFAARQFSVGQNSWPLLPTLSVVFIASVCGLVDRGAQLTILDQV